MSRDEVYQSKKNRFKIKEGETYDSYLKGLKMVYFGAQWFTLTRPVAEWIRMSNFARNLLVMFGRLHLDYDSETGLPSIFDEMYYQTAIMHSPYSHQIGNPSECLRFEKWGGCKYQHEEHAVPCMLGEDDTEEFNNTDCIFGRKFVMGQLPKIITNRLEALDKG